MSTTWDLKAALAASLEENTHLQACIGALRAAATDTATLKKRVMDQFPDRRRISNLQRWLTAMQKSRNYWTARTTAVSKLLRTADNKVDDLQTRLDNLTRSARNRADNAEKTASDQETARILGAELGEWRGFRWASTEPLVPSDTHFAIGGEMQLLDSGAEGYYGTETTTLKITDDTLKRALGSLVEKLGSQIGQLGSGPKSRAVKLGSGQSPSIHAAVTLTEGRVIRLELYVGSEKFTLYTSLAAGSDRL